MLYIFISSCYSAVSDENNAKIVRAFLNKQIYLKTPFLVNMLELCNEHLPPQRGTAEQLLRISLKQD